MQPAETQSSLDAAYESWKQTLLRSSIEAHRFGPPILMSVTPEYCVARSKVIVYGQETFGWEWNRRLRMEYPDYPSDWPFQDIDTFADFLHVGASVEALCWGYREFAFADRQPKTRRSPFWQAFRHIAAWPKGGALHSNLVKADYAPTDPRCSILLADEETKHSFIQLQQAKL
jgi:hypothetical protein